MAVAASPLAIHIVWRLGALPSSAMPIGNSYFMVALKHGSEIVPTRNPPDRELLNSLRHRVHPAQKLLGSLLPRLAEKCDR